jgi:hypothetical protein
MTLNCMPKKRKRVMDYVKNRYAMDEEYRNRIKEQLE